MAEVVTGEAVVLEVPCARFPSRLLALAIDLLIQFFLTFVLFVLLGVGIASQGLDGAAAAAVLLTITVLTLVGYPVIWETATRGRSPGKFAVGLRVVSDDGSPERFRQALVRGLATIVDFWIPPLFGVPALVCSLLSARGKRLGDVFAGTFVIQQRLPSRRAMIVTPSWMPPELAGWAAGLELPGLTDQTAAMARGYLGRLAQLTPSARAELGERIATAVSRQVSPPPPPGTPIPAYLAAVLAERNRRAHARLTRPTSPASPAPPPWAHPAAPPLWGQPAAPPPWAHPATLALWAQPAAAPAGQPPAPTPVPSASRWSAPTSDPAPEWKSAAWERELPGPGQPAKPANPPAPADPPTPAAGGFVPPQ
ncbi:MAG TPA: RDD family protein [Actinobacteria bacterium]|nr:RDD family protein [Actinomycetota bacterium]